MAEQSPRSLLMIRPASFGFNPETAGTNAFQQTLEYDDPLIIQQRAIEEFDRMVAILKTNDISVHVFDDSSSPPRPDVLFPNNWVSFHEDGKVILYPMMAENRRLERRPDIIEQLQAHFHIREIIDLSDDERSGHYLEGTGSVVFDYVNRIGYACRSPRTNEELVRKVCNILDYRAVVIDAIDERGNAIYHTNVMMWIGTENAVVCLDAIPSEHDQDLILDSFEKTGHRVIAISHAQVKAFAGNMYEVKSRDGELCLLLSLSAFESLVPGQVDALSKKTELIPIPADTIERHGGGSVRCMVAGIYLPQGPEIRF